MADRCSAVSLSDRSFARLVHCAPFQKALSPLPRFRRCSLGDHDRTLHGPSWSLLPLWPSWHRVRSPSVLLTCGINMAVAVRRSRYIGRFVAGCHRLSPAVTGYCRLSPTDSDARYGSTVPLPLFAQISQRRPRRDHSPNFKLMHYPGIAGLARAMIGCHCSADRVGDHTVAAIAVERCGSDSGHDWLSLLRGSCGRSHSCGDCG